MDFTIVVAVLMLGAYLFGDLPKDVKRSSTKPNDTVHFYHIRRKEKPSRGCFYKLNKLIRNSDEKRESKNRRHLQRQRNLHKLFDNKKRVVKNENK